MPIYNFDDCVYGEGLNPHTGTGPSINRKKNVQKEDLQTDGKTQMDKRPKLLLQPGTTGKSGNRC